MEESIDAERKLRAISAFFLSGGKLATSAKNLYNNMLLEVTTVG